jgi:RNA polymerase sigma factor (sigma-70 family)
LNILTEKRLLYRLRLKDRKAAERLIDSNYNSIYKFLLRLCKNKEIAEDLTQETFMKIWTSLEIFNGKSRILTWLYRISYNVFMDHIKKQKILINSANSSYFDNCIETNQTPDLVLMKKNDTIFLSSAIKNLSDKRKEIIIMHYQQELSIQEIAIILDIPKGTVKSRLNSALNQLRTQTCLQEYYEEN